MPSIKTQRRVCKCVTEGYPRRETIRIHEYPRKPRRPEHRSREQRCLEGRCRCIATDTRMIHDGTCNAARQSRTSWTNPNRTIERKRASVTLNCETPRTVMQAEMIDDASLNEKRKEIMRKLKWISQNSKT